MHKIRVFQCACITTENYWTVSINVLLRSIKFIHQRMHSLLHFDKVLKFTLKKQTSSVYDCTVKDVEYICNILRY